jgi:flagellar hook assembly protein FlgD
VSAFDPSVLGLRAAAPNQQAAPRETLGQGDFLTLLVTQLKNQDPLNPLDNEAFVAQLAQFSTVSGINSSNEKLDRLAQLAGADARSAAPQWIGRTVEGVDGMPGTVASVTIGADSALTLTLEDGRTLPASAVARIA